VTSLQRELLASSQRFWGVAAEETLGERVDAACRGSATGCTGRESLTRPFIERYAEHPHPAIDDGADHRPALIGTRGKGIGVDALEVEMTAKAVIVGEGVSNVLLRDGVLRDRVLVVTHQKHAS